MKVLVLRGMTSEHFWKVAQNIGSNKKIIKTLEKLSFLFYFNIKIHPEIQFRTRTLHVTSDTFFVIKFASDESFQTVVAYMTNEVL